MEKRILLANLKIILLMKLAQNHILPWCGYISLLDFVDEFVILDDIQFNKRSWQQRNKINLFNESFLLTVPVFSKKKFNQLSKMFKLITYQI